MGDVGEVLFGKIGREVLGAFYVIYCIFSAASHLLTFMIAMNVLTEHGACTIVWGVVGLVVFSILTIPRTLKNVSFLSIICASFLTPKRFDLHLADFLAIAFLSILSAVVLTIVALGVSPKAPYDAMQASYSPTFPSAFNSISNAVFAYGGHVAWLSFISELRHPEEFPKALITLQTIDISLYVLAATTIYRYAGEDVSSPALSSNGVIVSKVAWGIALPTVCHPPLESPPKRKQKLTVSQIIIAGVIFAHVTAKYVYLRMFAGTKYLHSRGLVATGSWIGLGVLVWTISWIIAQSIPNFSDLLGFISALCASWFSYGIPGFLWFYLNKGHWFDTPKMMFQAFASSCLILLGFIICGAGLYASGYQMSVDTSGSSWSCADNSK